MGFGVGGELFPCGDSFNRENGCRSFTNGIVYNIGKDEEGRNLLTMSRYPVFIISEFEVWALNKK